MDPNPNQPNYQPPQQSEQPQPYPQPDTQPAFNQPTSQPGFPEAPLQPQPMQPQPQAYGQSGQPQPGQHVENPGQTLGIISIVLSFVFLSVIGIILGIISRNKSKAAGQPATLGTIGMILGIVVTVISLGVFLTIGLATYAGIQELAKQQDDISKNSTGSGGSSGSSSGSSSGTSSLASDAAEVAKRAEAYYVIEGEYPRFKSDFEKHSESTVSKDITFNTAIVTNRNVTYLYCAEGSAQVLYFKSTAKDLAITPLGTASATESCVAIQ